MSANDSQPKPIQPTYDSDSTYYVNIVVEVSGEFTSRPVSPERRAVLLAEREQIARWQQELKERESQAAPRATESEGSDGAIT